MGFIGDGGRRRGVSKSVGVEWRCVCRDVLCAGWSATGWVGGWREGRDHVWLSLRACVICAGWANPRTHLRDFQRAEEDGGEGGLARVAEKGLVLGWMDCVRLVCAGEHGCRR